MTPQIKLQTNSSIYRDNIPANEKITTNPVNISNSNDFQNGENSTNLFEKLFAWYVYNGNHDYALSFNYKFNELNKLFNIKNLNNVKYFLLVYDSLFDILDELYPLLKFYFPNNDYMLDLIENNETGNFKLAVVIKMNYTEYDSKKIVANLMKVNSKIRPLKRKLNLINNFFIDVESV